MVPRHDEIEKQGRQPPEVQESTGSQDYRPDGLASRRALPGLDFQAPGAALVIRLRHVQKNWPWLPLRKRFEFLLAKDFLDHVLGDQVKVLCEFALIRAFCRQRVGHSVYLV